MHYNSKLFLMLLSVVIFTVGCGDSKKSSGKIKVKKNWLKASISPPAAKNGKDSKDNKGGSDADSDTLANAKDGSKEDSVGAPHNGADGNSSSNSRQQGNKNGAGGDGAGLNATPGPGGQGTGRTWDQNSPTPYDSSAIGALAAYPQAYGTGWYPGINGVPVSGNMGVRGNQIGMQGGRFCPTCYANYQQSLVLPY